MVQTLALRPRRFRIGTPDPARIAAESGAIAIHGVALLLLLAPLSPPPPGVAHVEPPRLYIEVPRKPNPPPVAPPREAEVSRPRLVPAAPTSNPPKMDVQPWPLVDPRPGDIAVEPIQIADAGTGRGEAITPPLAGAHLEYDAAPPPPYPAQAVRQMLTGTVTLRVLVDVDGRPLEVQVERSSGHRLLDAAARRQVLAKWRFRPATQDGRAVQAIGMVPVVFRLDR